jgi:hypothetical protein
MPALAWTRVVTAKTSEGILLDPSPLVLATVVYCNIGRVMKPMRHPFRTDMPHVLCM